MTVRAFSAPARIDLAGGTLDVAPLFFLIEGSVTVNLAIDRRVTVTGIGPDSGEAGAPGSIEREEPLFQLARAYCGGSQPQELEVHSEIPRASGLGGSSSTLVALVALLKQTRAADRLLEWVTVLEHRLLGKPAGTQDAIAAIYGGLSEIDFEQGSPQRSAIPMPGFLSGPLYMAYCDVQHHSGINNWAIIKAACEGEPRVLATLRDLAGNARRVRDALRAGSASHFTEAMFREAALRLHLSEVLMSAPMAVFAGALEGRVACKVCGAGGGGCMFLFGEDLDPDELAFVAERAGLQLLSVKADPRGCIEITP